MRSKLVISALTLCFSLVVFCQLNGVALGATPVTGPITGPITSALTSLIKGKVQIRFIGSLRRTMPNPQPAANVTVHARELFTHKTFTTQTDVDGNYILEVEPGIYFVKPLSVPSKTLAPVLRFVNIKKDQTKDDVDFMGYQF